MRKDIDLGGVGKIQLSPPRPSVAYDVISTWSGSPSRPHMGRLAAAAIGICGTDPRFPRYDTDQARPLSYGGLLLDHLMGRGASPNEILEAGTIVLADMAPILLTEPEVKKKSVDTEAIPVGE